MSDRVWKWALETLIVVGLALFTYNIAWRAAYDWNDPDSLLAVVVLITIVSWGVGRFFHRIVGR